MKTTAIVLAACIAGSPLAVMAQDHPQASVHARQNDAVKAPDRIEWARLHKGRNSFTADQARTRFEQAGYSRVGHLRLDRQGLWQAVGTRHGRRVIMALDFKGNLAER